jgi:DNA-binding transcriptional LysR family regulator
VVALPRSHPLASRERLSLAYLRDETWIEGHASECTNALLAAAERAGFEPKIAFEAGQWLGKQGLVAAGVGVTLIPSVALATVREDIVLRSLGRGAPTRQISLARQDRGYVAPAVAPMREILRRVADEHCFNCDALVDAPLLATT